MEPWGTTDIWCEECGYTWRDVGPGKCPECGSVDGPSVGKPPE